MTACPIAPHPDTTTDPPAGQHPTRAQITAAIRGRRRMSYSGRTLPTPHVLGGARDWTIFDEGTTIRAWQDHDCQVCGLFVPRGARVHVGFTTLVYQGFEGEPSELLVTSGPAVHAHCALVALRLCPTLSRDQDPDAVVGWLWTGRGQGLRFPASGDPEQQVCEEYMEPREGSQMLTLGDLRELVAAHH